MSQRVSKIHVNKVLIVNKQKVQTGKIGYDNKQLISILVPNGIGMRMCVTINTYELFYHKNNS